MTGPLVVLVTGLPGAGKSALAVRLRDALRLTLVGLDTVKEAIVDGLGPDAPDDRFAIRRAARDVVVALAAANPRGCVVDIWLNPTRDESEFTDALRAVEGIRVLEVMCRVPADVAVERYARRDRHAAHVPMDGDSEARIRAAAPAMRTLGLGPHVDIDTTSPVEGARWRDLLAWLADHGVAVAG